MKPSVLVVDDNKDILASLRILLCKKYNVTTETDPNKIPVLLRKIEYNVIILDMNFTKGVSTGDEGLFWLNVILDINPSSNVILITAYGDIELAVKGIKIGATDFIIKPWNNDKLLATLKVVSDLNIERKKTDLIKAQNKALSDKFPNIVGKSEPMIELFNKMDIVAKTVANVLITGENGVGKELVAKAIHDRSQVKNSAFISVDMGAIPETLFESEMFGYDKGAFTGADKSNIGKIEASTGGTLFLDEVGNIPLNLQVKLLRVLETNELTPLGSTLKKPFNSRLVCATNSNLEKLIQGGKFRQDLYYRINTIEITVPPLRERKNDIPELSNYYINKFKKKYNKNIDLSDRSLQRLIEYNWPGNIRELKNCIERAVILYNGNNELFMDLKNFDLTNEINNDYNLESVERKTIIDVLEQNSRNYSKAAKVLGITRATLYRKIEKYGI